LQNPKDALECTPVVHTRYAARLARQRFDRSTTVITAQRTSDLLRWTRFRDVSELRWKERKSATTFAGKIDIVASA
jgi:hypothetical protein